MEKYKSTIVAPENIQVDVSRDNNTTGKRIERVKLTHLPSGIEITKESWRSQLDAYNAALMDLEIQVGINGLCDYRKTK